MANLPEPVSAQRMRELERLAFERFSISPLTLMENAGRGVAELAMKKFSPSRVLVLCGKGNNGGDGFVCARYLTQLGSRVRVSLFADSSALKGESLTNFTRLRELNVPVFSSLCLSDIMKHDLIIDALFGTGLSRPVEGEVLSWISIVKTSGIPVLSVDIPSGLQSDTGEILGDAVKAVVTASLGAPKIGVFRGAGPILAGQIVNVDIGLPRQLLL